MAMRENIVSSAELREILLADIVLIIAFSLTFSGGLSALASDPNKFITNIKLFIPIAALAVTLSFVLHELMHKFVAQRFGAIAGFKTSTMGLAITLITGTFGFLIGIPGATMIYVQSFTKKENGLVSLAGPLTNFVVFGIFLALFVVLSPPTGSYLNLAISFTMFISIYLAFFNMLPIMPLDGSKVLAWSPPVYVVTMGIIFAIIYFFGFLPITSLIYLLVFALIISTFYRRLF